MWRYQMPSHGNGKPLKVPYYTSGRPRSGQHLSPDDRRNLDTYDNALATMEKQGAAYSGIGLAMVPENRLMALDLDNCLNEAHAFKAVSAQQEDIFEVAKAQRTYIEISPSGRGLRIFYALTGAIPPSSKDVASGVETFTTSGFVTVTGRRHPDSGNAVAALHLVDKPKTNADYDADDLLSEPPPVLSSGEQRELIEEIRGLLKHVPPDTAYDEWLSIGAAIHHASSGFAWGRALWDEWSAGTPVKPASKYCGGDGISLKWESFGKRSASAPRATLGTVRHIAQRYGWDGGFGEILNQEAIEHTAELGRHTAWQPKDELTITSAMGRLNAIMDKHGKIKATPRPTYIFLQCPELSRMRIVYDCFKDELRRHMLDEPERSLGWQRFDDATLGQLAHNMDTANFTNISESTLRQQIAVVAKENQFDSAKEWLEALTWDGKPRVESFLWRYFGAEIDVDDGDMIEYTRLVSRYMWTALAGRAMTAGAQADMVVVFSGDQGTGKSTGIKAMSPTPMEHTSIDLNFIGADVYRVMRGKFTVELAELSGMSKAELEKVKAFITQTEESWVPKYKEYATFYRRRCVFFGTTNEKAFLFDETGNRRWLPIQVVRQVDVEGISRDHRQLWAEAREMYNRGGVAWQVSDSKAAAVMRERFSVVDSATDAIRAYVTKENSDAVDPADVLRNALGLTIDKHTRAMSTKLGRVLDDMGYTSVRVGREKKRIYVRRKSLTELNGSST